MIIQRLGEDAPIVIVPSIFHDDRGYFYESFNSKEFKEKVADIDFVQDNQSQSRAFTLRGLHFQMPPYDQAKLVRVVEGAIVDVAVDIRKESPNYGKWYAVMLSSVNNKQLFIPSGFAHGFVALDNGATVQYKCNNFYNKESEGGIIWNDSTINIPWEEFANTSEFILSDKDKEWITLEEYGKRF